MDNADYIKKIAEVKEELQKTTSWKRRNDLAKYLHRLQKELKIYERCMREYHGKRQIESARASQ